MNGDGTYNIKYADGDSERGVIAEYIRALNENPATDTAPNEGGFAKDTEIEARYRGKKNGTKASSRKLMVMVLTILNMLTVILTKA